MGTDTDKEEMEDVILENEKEHHFSIFFEDNKGGIVDKK